MAKYEGDFVMDTFHGEGKLKTGHYYYEGTFKDGKRDGKGKCTWSMKYGPEMKPYKIIYQGFWKDDKMEGDGLKKFYFLDNCSPLLTSSWEGQFEKGLFRKGKEIHYDSGTVFEGNFGVGERKAGQGIVHYRNGNSFDGEWKENRKNGLGRYVNKVNGCVYDVKWVGNEITGKGRINYPSGALYTGFLTDISDKSSSSAIQYRSPPPSNMFPIQYSSEDLKDESKDDFLSVDKKLDGDKNLEGGHINENKINKTKDIDIVLPMAEQKEDSNRIAIPHGYGVMTYPPEDNTDGEENNIPNRLDEDKYLYRYEGDFYKGQRHGSGKGYFKINNQPGDLILEGQWQNDCFVLSK